ncbi:hypothetical protein ACJMK2_020299 [Sinanodonta woodiana]|uniref:Uncharacterized protein n=1 Tax=Sinanodonta woodiana TaxID=1069815 RepID=A0ABD3TYU3_SINWO
MRALIIICIFGLVSYIGLSHTAPVLVKKGSQENINSTAVLKIRRHILYRKDATQLLRNQIQSARHQAEDLFHEYVYASAFLPDGYEITEKEVLNIFPQVNYTVSQIFSLYSAAALLRQLTEAVTSLRPAIASTLTVEGLPIDGRLLDHLEELAGQMNQILYRLPATSNNLTTLIVTNVDSDDQKRVMAVLSVTKYFLEYLFRNV